MPRAGIAVHERLRPHEVARRPTFHEVAGNSEGSAAEADQRLLLRELPADGADRLEGAGVRLRRPERLDVGAGGKGPFDNRADTLDELDADAHPEDRRHDVREENGCVDVVAPHRLERHLRAKLRRLRHLEERVLPSNRPVLRKRAARLAHEPDRRTLDRLGARDADEKRLGHATYTSAGMSTSGPLVARWRSLEHGMVEAGSLVEATVVVENAGTAPWRTRGPEEGLFLSYHWLDERENPIVWDGIRTPLDRTVDPGAELRQQLAIRAPIPPGRYRLGLDLVEEHRFWLAELGSAPYAEDVDVGERDASAARVFGAEPDGEWLARARALHSEGYAAVGGAIDARGFDDYAPGGGRHPRVPPPPVG